MSNPKLDVPQEIVWLLKDANNALQDFLNQLEEWSAPSELILSFKVFKSRISKSADKLEQEILDKV